MSGKYQSGVGRAMGILGNHTGDYGMRHVTTLAWIRIMTDDSMPEVALNDPRSILRPFVPWSGLADPLVLMLMCKRLNHVMGEDLLADDWDQLPESDVTAAYEVMTKWVPMDNGSDLLGPIYQEFTSQSGKAAKGAFYTPYHVSLMMARMTAPGPGQSVCDPACGSGGMLLAALEVCREEHGVDCEPPHLYGVDIDAEAVRLSKLNLYLAGVGSTIAREDSLLGQQIKRATLRDRVEARKAARRSAA
jgi:hypothetical protein